MIKQPVQDAELAEYLAMLPPDEMLVFTMAEGRVRGAVSGGTTLVNQMRAQHGTGILESYILGQACLCASLLIPALMKGREHVSWRYEAPGSPAAGFSVEADSLGWVRGYLLTDHIPVDKPLENWDLRPFLGSEDGFMTIQKVSPGDKYPQVSSVNTTGNIADDLVFYFDRSEQQQTAVHTSIQMDKEGRITGAGALYVQLMPSTGGSWQGQAKPGAQLSAAAPADDDEELVARIEAALAKMPSLGKWYSLGRTGEALLDTLFADLHPSVAVRRSIIYDCPCSRDAFLSHIRHLNPQDLDGIRAAGEPVSVTCQNCSSVYTFAPGEL